jgi:phosphoribosylformylglycinamidine synthase
MVTFFKSKDFFYAVQFDNTIDTQGLTKLIWLFQSETIHHEISGKFIGPKKEMISPFSTNAVEITQNMGITGIFRIEKLLLLVDNFDKMLFQIYENPDESIFELQNKVQPQLEIDDIQYYNVSEGLALSSDEVEYLKNLSTKLNRKLTDSEVYGFAQVNSEHCRHKIFNGTFIIDDKVKEKSLFDLIKDTVKVNPGKVVSAFKDNVAFIKGPQITQFAPLTSTNFFESKQVDSVISIKAETHNFPTTVEPFNGAATGTGGEIRDRLAGGRGSIPLTGTAVYMTSYPRLNCRIWEKSFAERKWLYQNPKDILIKASNGASDFGNKFGQPLINGSVLTFEHQISSVKFGYDKMIMLAGGVGIGKFDSFEKETPKIGDKIVVMGGDNYRIGMGGGAVSSVTTGELSNSIELGAIQRSNPEMQKRVSNVIRQFVEMDSNPIKSIHDHGAGGHLNSLSELVEKTGGHIDISKLPIGDKTLSFKEIIGNESQERMGLIIDTNSVNLLQEISDRERSPMSVVGEISDDSKLLFYSGEDKPIDLQLNDFFGKLPKITLEDTSKDYEFDDLIYDSNKLIDYIQSVLRLESVACKDWLTNKVDRSVTGRVAKQQNCGKYHLPLNNLAATALDYESKLGIVNSIGHAPISGLIDSGCGSRLSVSEALLNIIWSPINDGLSGISLSANWMWPAKNKHENARLFGAVESLSNFAINLGVNIPTGKDSLSMKQKYEDCEVLSPGTVIITAVAQTDDFTKIVEPNLQDVESSIVYIDFSKCDFNLGGSAFAQILSKVGTESPDILDCEYFKKSFDTIQKLIYNEQILSGHDISSGGLITTLFEMQFVSDVGLTINTDSFSEKDLIKILFSEKPAIIIQINDKTIFNLLEDNKINYKIIGETNKLGKFILNDLEFNISEYRDIWFETSTLLDSYQTKLSEHRSNNYKQQPLYYNFPKYVIDNSDDSKITAAIIREKGVNGDREMAFALHKAGFKVKDVHMTDLISGKEDLSDINMIVFVGGFSNSDVLGSAKGWAGSFKYNKKANDALTNFYNRKDTLSLGVCNGCQLMMQLDLIQKDVKMSHNDSEKFESSFVSVEIPENNSVMLKNLSGTRLGVWVAHGEGKFNLQKDKTDYNIALKWGYTEYPGNPNGSDYDVAGLCSSDGRHLAMMPHLERSIFTWQWPYYTGDKNDILTPWIQAFLDARKWCENFYDL